MKKDQYYDRLITEEAGIYERCLVDSLNRAASEAHTPALKDILLTLLVETHSIKSEMFAEAYDRGWHRPEQASESDIAIVKNRINQFKST